MISCVNPASFIVASGSEKSANWNVEYVLSSGEVSGEEIPVSETEGKTMVSVKAGEDVHFMMNLMPQENMDAKRFKETFSITMPTYVYYLLTDYENEKLQLGETDLTECGYILEGFVSDKGYKASNSNATAGNAGAATESDAREATESNADQTVRKVELRFVEELRTAAHPEDYAIADTEIVLTFPADMDMEAECQQKGNNCEITLVPATSGNAMILPLGIGDEWDIEWKLKIKRANGAVVDVNPGQQVTVNNNDEVVFDLSVTSNLGGPSTSFDETFKIQMQKEFYDMLTSFDSLDLKGPDNNEHPVFKYSANNSDPTTLTIGFDDYWKSSNMALNGAAFSFGMKSSKDFTLRYSEGQDQWVINYANIQAPAVSLAFAKAKSHIIRGTKAEASSTVIAPGDYVFYTLRLTASNLKDNETYKIEQGVITDYYNADVFDFVDLTTQSASLAALLSSDSSTTAKTIKGYLASDQKYLHWVTAAKPAASGVPSFANGNAVKNGSEIILDKTNNSATMIICLQAKKLMPSHVVPGDYRNCGVWNNRAYVTGMDGGSYYDAGLTISPTTKMRKGAAAASVMPISTTYPANVTNEMMKVGDGDLVTYMITVYNEGYTAFKVRDISINVPLGLEMIGSSTELTDVGYKYAGSAGSAGVPSQLPTSVNHIYPNAAGTLQKFSDYDSSGQPYEDLYQVQQYTYNPASMKLSRWGNSSIYITCRVKGIDQILAAAGVADNAANRTFAERYGYLITAEISDIIDGDGDLSTSPSVMDEDSYTNPSAYSFEPSAVQGNGSKWACVVIPENGAEMMEIEFGNIENNAYKVTYFAVVDAVSNAYSNEGKVVWLDGSAADEASFSKWDVRSGHGQGKTVSVDGVNYEKEIKNPTLTPGGGLKLYYRLLITVGGNKTYDPGQLNYVDDISDLGLGSSNIAAIADIKLLNNQLQPISGFKITPDTNALKVDIVNDQQVSSDFYYVDFSVTYNKVPYGSAIHNTFGVSTKVETPLVLNLSKRDGNNGRIVANAEFKMYYDAAATKPVKNIANGDVVMTTDGYGQASAQFLMDQTQIEADGSYYLYLKETKTPKGYFDFGGKDSNPVTPCLIQIKVTETNGVFQFSPAITGQEDYYEISAGSANELVIKAINYRSEPVEAEANFQATKVLTGRNLQSGEFDFEARLIKTVSGSRVVSGPQELIVGSPMDLDKLASANDPDPTDNIKFPQILFDKDGVYVFAISEVNGGTTQNNVIHDGTVYYAVVTVTLDNQTKILSADVKIYDSYNLVSGTPGSVVSSPTFTNRYVITTLDLALTKKLIRSGTRKVLPVDQAYEFTLRQTGGNTADVVIPYSTVANDSSGKQAAEIEFKDIEVKAAGVYTFEITETLPATFPAEHSADSYDPGIITAAVTVSNISGMLTVTDISYQKTLAAGNEKYFDTNAAEKDTTFVNIALPKDAIIQLNKISNESGNALHGAQFALSYRALGSSDA